MSHKTQEEIKKLTITFNYLNKKATPTGKRRVG